MKQVKMLVLLLLAGWQIHAQKKLGNDSLTLSRLNSRFIRNFISNDTAAHNEVVYKDFLCIASNGRIIGRNEYMKDWAHGYDSTIFISFVKMNESIRFFGDMALVRSETLATFKDKGNIIQKKGLYTDTYVRVKGRWWCVQAQLTPLM